MAFQKGKSGNPGGRPKGLTACVQAKAGKDGKKLVAGFWAIAFGTPAERLKTFGERVDVTTKDRLSAMSELTDRGFGKAPQTVAHEGADVGPVLVRFVDA